MTLELDPQRTTRVDYRSTYGWPVERHRDGLRLVTGSGVGAVVVPRAMSDSVLARLRKQGCSGPALGLPTRRERITVLLVETDDFTVAQAPLPEGVRVLPAGSVIPLPDERHLHGPAQWLVEPDPFQRWLPSVGAVLATIAAAGQVHRELLAW